MYHEVYTAQAPSDDNRQRFESYILLKREPVNLNWLQRAYNRIPKVTKIEDEVLTVLEFGDLDMIARKHVLHSKAIIDLKLSYEGSEKRLSHESFNLWLGHLREFERDELAGFMVDARVRSDSRYKD